MKYIYALIDPRDRSIRYIGQTDDIERRYLEHTDRTENTTKGAWIADLRRLGTKPVIALLEQVENDQDINYREKWWIVLGKRQGWRLTNIANPSSRRTVFSELFSEHLRQEHDAFMSAIHDRAPLVMITRAQFGVFVFAVKMLLCILVGMIAGYVSWNFDYNLTGDISTAILNGLTGALSCGLLLLLIFLEGVKKWWWATLYIGFYMLVAFQVIGG